MFIDNKFDYFVRVVESEQELYRTLSEFF